MGFISTFMNSLFGKEKHVEIKGIGVVSCKICSWYRSGNYIWSGYIHFPLYPESTLFLIDGNTDGPYAEQEESLLNLLGDWNKVTNHLNKLLPEESKKRNKADRYINWQECFYPEAIVPDSSDSGSWEVTFNGAEEIQDEYFSFMWQNGVVMEPELG